MNYRVIEPNWPAPANIKAYTTLRTAGDLSQFAAIRSKTFDVQKNRDLLKLELKLPSQPIWLNQTHTTTVVLALPENRDKEADASYSSQPNTVCVAMTADCLPILLCHKSGTHVASIHAGWRGLGAGVIENTLNALNVNNQDLLVWLGPAISQPNFEVGEEVRELFLSHDKAASSAFIPSPQGRWLADLYQLARMRLTKLGVSAIYGGDYCTYADPERFFSFRRDKGYHGNMASLIWISNR